MMGTRGLVLAVVCITYLCISNAFTTVEHPLLEFADKELIFSAESLKDGKLTFATCTKNTTSKERQCTVVREISPETEEMKSCDITVSYERRSVDSDMDQDIMRIFPSGEKKAVLYTLDHSRDSFIQFNIVDLDTCKVGIYVPSSSEDNIIIVPYKDSFDIYFYNHESGKDNHIVKFGPDGVKEDRPLAPTEAETFSPEIARIVSISGSPDKGLAYVERAKDIDSHEFYFKLRKLDGSDVSVAKQVLYDPSFLETNDDLIGVCFKMQNTSPKFNCTQHNLNGEEKFNVNPLGDDNKSAVVSLHNLPEGGMLVIVGRCEADICSFHDVDFSAIKVDSIGKIVGTAKIGKVKAVSDTNNVEMAITFHTDKDKNICISIGNFEGIETGRRNGGLLRGSTYCLTDADFTK